MGGQHKLTNNSHFFYIQCTEAKDRCPSCPFESNQLAPLVRTASFVARLIDSLP